MSDLIEEGPGVYYTGFSTGQGGDPSTYKLYAEHLDVNFDTLIYAVNRIWTRLSAMTGFNAALISYVLELNDSGGPEGAAVDTGRIGADSYSCALKGGDPTKIEVQPGSALRVGQLVTLDSMQEVDGTGVLASPPGWAYLSWDANGTVLIDDNTSAYDFARWYWSGGQFTGSVEYLTPTLFDGDAWREFQEVPANLIVPSGTRELPHNRVLALERFFSGYDTDGLGNAIGPLALPVGSVTDPQVCFGAAGVAHSAGWYPSATDEWAYTTGAAQVLRIFAEGIRFAISGAANAPVIQLNADHTGFFADGSGRAAVTQADVTCMTWEDGADNAGQALLEAGTEANPPLAAKADPTTGFRAVSGQADVVVDGVAEVEVVDGGAVTLPHQCRCRVEVDAFSLSDAAAADIQFDTEDFDEGHAGSGMWIIGTPTEVKVCHAGTYAITAHANFNESSAGAGANTGPLRRAQLEVGGSSANHAGDRRLPMASGDTPIVLSEIMELAADAIVTVEAEQDNTAGTAMTVAVELAVCKIA